MQEKAWMTGPEHFRAGEEALQKASHLDPQANEEEDRLHRATLAEAEVHFAAAQTLLWASMLASDSSDSKVDEDTVVANGWARLLGIKADGE